MTGSSSDSLRIVLAGAGRMARHHALAIRQLDFPASVVAVADPDAEAVEGVRSVWPNARRFRSIEDALEATDSDIVHVCTPAETHAALAETALLADRHVYVEKPVAATLEQASRLVDLARDRDLVLCPGHQLLFERPARRTMEALHGIGDPVHLESYFSFRPVRTRGDGGTPLSVDAQLMDVLPHPVYLALAFLERTTDGSDKSELGGLETGPGGTVHALIRRGAVTANLVVTLEGRPVESYLRLIGTNGSIQADFVRSSVVEHPGPGTSTLDKLLYPYSESGQILRETTAALARRVLERRRSYPGLREIFTAFYGSVSTGSGWPVSPQSIRETVEICEAIGRAIEAPSRRSGVPVSSSSERPTVVVTGGTGFLGRAVTERLLERGHPVRVLARRHPAPWETIPGAEFRSVDLGAAVPPDALAGAEMVVHCAAATSGGWDAHRRNSIAATENLLKAAAAAGVTRLVHVSSIAVLDSSRDDPIGEETPLVADPEAHGPYVWGKTESERLARATGPTLGIDVKIVRPAAIVDNENFDPPGRLGKRVGGTFVAVGSPDDTVGIVEIDFASEVLAWYARRFDDAPATLNLLSPDQPTKRELVARLIEARPGLKVVWLPRALLLVPSFCLMGLSKLRNPTRPPIRLHEVFATRAFDLSRVGALRESTRPTPPHQKHGRVRGRRMGATTR